MRRKLSSLGCIGAFTNLVQCTLTTGLSSTGFDGEVTFRYKYFRST
jgi:hypothetical protein